MQDSRGRAAAAVVVAVVAVAEPEAAAAAEAVAVAEAVYLSGHEHHTLPRHHARAITGHAPGNQGRLRGMLAPAHDPATAYYCRPQQQ